MMHSIEAEHAVLGAALSLPAECGEAYERVRAEHFFDPIHARLWQAVLARVHSGSMPDPVVIASDMGSLQGFADLGGLRFLADLMDAGQTWALASHIEIVLDRAQRRAIHALTAEVSGRLKDTAESSAEALLADLERGAADIARDGASRPLAVPAGLTALENIEAAINGDFVGVPTGLEWLDHVTGGIRQDDVWFIGGRTSMGKSVVALSLGKGIAQQGRGVMMFSLEMPLREVQMRLVSDLAFTQGTHEPVRYGDLLKGRISSRAKDMARIAAKRLASLPFVVTDQGGLTIDEIRAQAQRQVRAWEKSGVKSGAIIIDHIGLVKPARQSDSKAAETSYVVNELKALAKQLRCPIIALCQVNRQTEGRNDKRPTLADLNWSGAIEQIADMICLLYRPAYYLERSSNADDRAEGDRVAHDLEMLVHKNRAGPICTVRAWVDVACNAVRDLPSEGREYA